ncbi:WD repeat-containing protein 26 homolog [Typha angustifolia]|uniref:WD repeat-containing protein 26 homolog n=1 Tax=Typha angustifolia TaxID=59011 RepID=UPI003C2C3A2E
MGGVEDDEPAPKRVKESLLEFGSLPNNSSLSKPVSPLGGLMARPLPSQGKDEIVGSKGVIKRVEFVKIITKALYSLGYERSGAILEEESGIYLHSSSVNLFRKHVLDGNWNESVTTLHKIGLLDENVQQSASLLILEQKFFELLENDRVMDALNVLRTEITPLNINKERLHELSSFIISPVQCFILGFPKPVTESSNSRLKLLDELQKLLPPALMIPERRLEHLVEQALSVQREACYYHNSLDGSLSLYTDHQCGKDQIPSWTTQVLQAHHDEVWYLQFSNNGKYLASSSNDRSAIVWEVHEDGELSLKHKLTGHQKPVLMVAWSPDDCQLLTCGLEEVVRRWDIQSGECLHVYEKAGLGLISCGWFPDGNQFFSGVTDKSICLWDLEGKELDCWKGQRSTKTSEMAVTKDGRLVISMSRESTILLLDREAKLEKLIEEEQTITSFLLSKDDNFLLVNLVNQEIHLWSIKGDPKLITRYKGYKRSRFLIRSCFGGFEQAFVASGSEDSQVYIWHRSTGDLIKVLPGHSGAVNCVSWNPANPHMLASASDDHTIRIWGVNRVSLKRKDDHSNGAIQCNGKSKSYYNGNETVKYS